MARPAALPDHLVPVQASSSSPSPGDALVEKQAALRKEKEQETMQGF